MEQTALITGCSSGIGRATALAFTERGWRVYATAREADDVAELADAGCETDSLDVTDETEVRRVVKRAETESRGIDCLVSNAGYGQFGPLEAIPEADVRRQFEVNAFGFHRLVRRALPEMRERGDGTVVAVSSVLGRVAGPGTGAYSGSKAALEAMCDSLRTEVEADGVDVVSVQPAFVDTGFASRAREELPEDLTADGAGDAAGDYEWVDDLFADVSAVGEGGPFSVPPERVADTIVDAACAERPAARYPVGSVAKLALYGRYLPDAWRDLLYGVLRRVS
jgi:NAD(P)-dependent dehydrogenase (short-subunit alcohol dehydrogenase family)